MELPVAVGQIIAKKYRVDRVIGQGGMGIVVAGFYLELEQPVAIKFLLSETGLQSEGAERFRREARAAAKIRSEHVARVFDIGLFEERVPYMVMELLRGHDLEQEIESRGPLPIGEAVGYLLQAIDAVAEAHSVGIVHRDLKPTNLFLAERADGSRIIKVLDFGISKSLGAGRPPEVALTRTAAFVGSPLYMSPEQMRSARDVDARTDVWSLGAILYIMLTGQLPHPGQSLPEVCLAVMNSSPRPLKDFLHDAPEELDHILTKCLAKDLTHRYSSVAELAERLLPFAPEWHLVVERSARLLGGVPHAASHSRYPHPSNPAPGSLPTAQRSSAPVMKDQQSPSATEAPWSKTGRKGRRNRRLPVLVASLLGAVLGLLSILVLRSKSTPPQLVGTRGSSVASVPGAGLETASSEAHAANQVEPPPSDATPRARDATPAPSASVPSASVPSASAPQRSPARASAQSGAATDRYTYFGGRR
jgi:eukaryotic-like serine/threonine-protein kinase